jgi:hypothetical protein
VRAGGGTSVVTPTDRERLQDAIEELDRASSLTRPEVVGRLLSRVDALTDGVEGLEHLLDSMPALVDAGLFEGGPWEDPGRLVPSLVGGTLRAGDRTTLMEILSELRMLALAQGRMELKGFSSTRARRFLEETMVRNLDLVFLEEEGRGTDGVESKIVVLMKLLRDRIPIASLKPGLATEIALLCIQRPIVTDRALELLRLVRDHIPIEDRVVVAEGLPDDGQPEWEDPDPDRRLSLYLNAAFTPSEAAQERNADEYRSFLEGADGETLAREVEALGRGMRETGLAIAHHAHLLRRVAGRDDLLAAFLGLSGSGEAELRRHRPFVRELIDRAVQPELARVCHGLGRLLDRGLLSQQPVRIGLERFLTLELHPEVARGIEESRPGCSMSPEAILLADTINVLGQPLGIGQGKNPTCQSARGISLWSRHAPGKLLNMIQTVGRSFDLSMRFEGDLLKASDLGQGLVRDFDHDLDAVSVVLVPHLDRIYNEMMRRAAYRGEDPHKWVNPAMYGHWIPTDFSSAYDYATDSIQDYETFLRTFYATHHPAYNRGHDLAYPNPVGIFLTAISGALVGFHAISILRVREVRGSVRVFLYNPNSEGRQRWHADIRPTVAGHGELPGESSLPFDQFASRLYAFHFNPSDVGEPDQVPDEVLERVKSMARPSWGASYRWAGEGLPGMGGPAATPMGG